MYISELPIVIVRNLLFTVIIEILISLFFGYRKKDLLNVLLVNFLTNPLLNSTVVAINFFGGLKYRNISLIILEILVVVIEGNIYQKYLINRKINGYLLSLILNLSSFGIGLLINK